MCKKELAFKGAAHSFGPHDDSTQPQLIRVRETSGVSEIRNFGGMERVTMRISRSEFVGNV